EQRAGLARERAELQGRVAAIEAAERATDAREAGQRAVREALPTAPTLLDLVDPAEDDPDLGALLDERLLLPVARERAEVLRASSAAGAAGRAALLWLPRQPGHPVARLLERVAVVDTLEEALDHHARAG